MEYYVISTLGYMLFAHSKGVDLGHTPALVILSQIVFLYAFSLFGFLLAGVYILSAGGMMLLVSGLIKNYKNTSFKVSFLRIASSPGFVLFVLFSILSFVIFEPYVIKQFDEFTCWGSLIKYLHAFDALPIDRKTLGFAAYPPGIGLFDYYVTYFTGFHEGYSFAAQSLLFLAVGAVLLNGVRWNNYIKLMIMSAFFYLLLLLSSARGFDSLQVDNVLGVVFGLSLISTWCLFKHEENSKSWLILFLLSMAVLPLIKEMGYYFSAFTLFVLIGIMLYENKIRNMSWERIYGIFGHSPVILLAVFFISTLVKISWSLYMSHYGIGSLLPVNFSLQWLYDVFYLTNNEVVQNRNEKFISAYTGYEYYGGTHFLDILLLSLYLSFMLILIDIFKDSSYKFVFVTFMIIIAFIIYNVTLLLVYQFVFPPFILEHYLSLDRYLMTFFFGWLMLLMYRSINGFQEISFNIAVGASSFLLLFLTIPVFSNISSIKDFAFMKQYETRNSIMKLEKQGEFRRLSKLLLSSIDGSSKVLVIADIRKHIFTEYLVRYLFIGHENIQTVVWYNSAVLHSSDLEQYDYILVTSVFADCNDEVELNIDGHIQKAKYFRLYTSSSPFFGKDHKDLICDVNDGIL